MQKIQICASQVAKAAGMNRYYPCDNEFILEMKRYNNKKKIKSKLDQKIDTLEETEIDQILANHVIEPQIFNPSPSLIAEEPSKINPPPPIPEPTSKHKVTILKSLVEQQIKPFVSQIIVDEIKVKKMLIPFELISKEVDQVLSMKRGITLEKQDLNNLEVKLDTEIVKRNDKCYLLMIPIVECGTIITMIGKFDGVNKDGRVVETKRRRNKLFKQIPLYEQVQLEIYIRMSKTTEILHVQNFRKNTVVTVYRRNNKFWEEILNGLRIFIKKYNAP